MTESAAPITIVLADDHPVVRHGLRLVLEAQPEFQVIGETGDGLEAVRLVQRLNPKILIVDVSMPGLNGLDVARQVKQISLDTHVIILSMHATESFVLEALKSGVTGYILKDSALTDLVPAMRDVAAGKRFLSSKVSEQAIDLFIAVSNQEHATGHDTLTDREREVFQLVVEGLTNARIGKRLFISPRTVESHRRTMMHKLGLNNRMELLAYAVKRGIISVEQPPAEDLKEPGPAGGHKK